MKKVLLVLLLLTVASLRCAPTTEVKLLGHGGRERSYRLHVPPRAADPAALVVVLHGGGGNAAQMERYSRFSNLADGQGFLVAYPEGVDHGWNDGRAGEFTTAHRENVDDVGFVRAVVEDIARQHRLDRRKIYVTGISNGGFMSSRLGAEAADLFAAIAPVVAGIPKSWSEQLAPARPLSVLIVQGTEDPLVPYFGGFVQVGRKQRGELIATDEAVRKWCQVLGCATTAEAEAMPDNDADDGCRALRFCHTGGREGSEVVLLRVDGGGHTWPGSSQYLPKSVIGPVCRDFDATAEIWKFFKRH